jgi:uncharacterized membrane protein YedE/YeeE
MVNCSQAPSFVVGSRITALLFFVAFSVASFVCGSTWRKGLLFFISGGLGFFLKWGGFGFCPAFRSMLYSGSFVTFVHILIMLMLATSFRFLFQIRKDASPVFYPGAKQYHMAENPVSLNLVLGSYMFGIGMMLGSGCASGTLVGVGSGFIKACLVLICLVAGITLGISDPFYESWSKWPKTHAITFKWYITVAVLAAFAIAFLAFEIIKHNRRAHTSYREGFDLEEAKLLMILGVENEDVAQHPALRLKLFWPYSMDALVAIALALYFGCTGEPISVGSGLFTLGSHVFLRCGGNPKSWKYWKDHNGFPENLMDMDSFLSDCFIVLGSFVASSLMKHFGKYQQNSLLEIVKGVFGGFLMGIGGSMSYGCNMGALVSGIMSSSLHGFLWFLCAILGAWTVIGVEKLWDRRKVKQERYACLESLANDVLMKS